MTLSVMKVIVVLDIMSVRLMTTGVRPRRARGHPVGPLRGARTTASAQGHTKLFAALDTLGAYSVTPSRCFRAAKPGETRVVREAPLRAKHAANPTGPDTVSWSPNLPSLALILQRVPSDKAGVNLRTVNVCATP
jgi:hypothetical protein